MSVLTGESNSIREYIRKPIIPVLLCYLATVLSMGWNLRGSVLGGVSDADASNVWIPLAQNVLDGATLYLDPTAVDNKPPLWEYVIILGSHFNAAIFAMFATVAVGNILIIYGAYRLSSRITERPWISIVAAVVTMLILFKTGVGIQNKSLPAGLAIMSLVSRKPGRSGILYGLAIMFAQQTILGFPALLYQEWNRSSSTRSLLRSILGVCSVIIVSFLSVGIFFGIKAIPASIYWTFGSALEYVVGTPYPDSALVSFIDSGIITGPAQWTQNMRKVVTPLLYPIICSAGGLYVYLAGFLTLSHNGRQTAKVVLLFTGLLSLIFIIASWPHYWNLIAGPMGIASSLFVFGIVQRLE